MGGVEVSELTLMSPPSLTPRRPGTHARNFSPWIGITGTLLLHGAAISSFISGVHAPHPLDSQVAGAKGVTSIPADTLVLLNLTGQSKSDSDPLVSIASIKIHVQQPTIDVAPLVALSTPSVESPYETPSNSSPAAANPGDAAGLALMYGRYTGQISARIERAWMRPRSPVSDGTRGESTETDSPAIDRPAFRCRVQIRQDIAGNVQEVLLIDCNGTEAWRHSLVVAINQASPLPAPPTRAVFTRALIMTFEHREYRIDGIDNDDFEPGQGPLSR